MLRFILLLFACFLHAKDAKFFINSFENRFNSDCLIIPFFEGNELATSYDVLDSFIEKPLREKDFTGSSNQTTLIYTDSTKEKRVLLVGLGKKEDISILSIKEAYSSAIKSLISNTCLSIEKLSIIYPDAIGFNNNFITTFADAIFCSNYVFDKIHKKNSLEKTIKEFQIMGINENDINLLYESYQISKATNLVRNLVNDNAYTVTPEYLKNFVEDLKTNELSSKINTKMFNKAKLGEKKFDLILAVNQGSNVDPYLIQIEYNGKPNTSDKTILIGKGVTYDTGGLSLKPSQYMDTMRCDMAGGALVIGIIYALAILDIPVNVIGLIPAVENSIGANSYKPGDVYNSYSGKTVEIINTDAEGRLILADSISYACKELKPTRIIDVATLTGSMIHALGREIAGYFSNDKYLTTKLETSSKNTGELIWQMPLHKRYLKALKSDIADIKNCSKSSASDAITSALFLQEFLDGNISWAHIDLTTAFLNEGFSCYPSNASGYGVRLLFDFFKEDYHGKTAKRNN